jgi:hypothetical protein
LLCHHIRGQPHFRNDRLQQFDDDGGGQRPQRIRLDDLFLNGVRRCIQLLDDCLQTRLFAQQCRYEDAIGSSAAKRSSGRNS